MNRRIPRTRSAIAGLGLIVLCACATEHAVPTAGQRVPGALGRTDLLLLRPLPAHAVEVKIVGKLEPLYAAASGINGKPAPYDGAVHSSLFLCGGLGPLFGACAGVMVGVLAVAGVTTSVVESLQESSFKHADPPAVPVAPDTSPAANLSARIAAEAVARARKQGQPADLTQLAFADSCATPIAGTAARAVADIEIVKVQIAFAPGYEFRLTMVALVSTRTCGALDTPVERRIAYLGKPYVLSKDAARATATFNNEMDNAARTLARDVFVYLTGA